MKRRKPAEFDSFADEQQAKRQLLHNLAKLSLEPSSNYNDRMDLGDPNIVYLPDVDEFLHENEPSQLVIPIPEQVLAMSFKSHFYNRPSTSLVKYEPAEQLILQHLWKYLHNLSYDTTSIDQYDDYDDQAMEID